MDYSWLGQVAALGIALFYLLALFCTVEAILQARTSQGAIAWAISLLTFPFVTVPLFLVFGRNRFAGYLERRDQMEQQSLELVQHTSSNIQEYIIPVTADTPLYSSLFNLARMPATRGNEVDLLIDGQATFDSIREGLAQAKHYILFQFYIIRDDDLSRELGRILADKAREGVDVYLIYDEIGSRQFQRSRLCRQLHMSGVKVAPFNTTQGWSNRFQLNFRNHRKVVVVDGKWRNACLENAINCLSSEGIVIFDNSDRYAGACKLLRERGYLEIDFSGPGPINGYAWTIFCILYLLSSLMMRLG